MLIARTYRTVLSIVLLFATFCTVIPAAKATDINWLGGTSTAWGTAANWNGGIAPANNLTADRAVFGAASYTNQPNAGTTSIAGIVMGTSAAVTITTTSLSIGASGIDMSAATNNMTLGTTVLGASQTWTVNASRTLSVGAITGATFSITKAGTGTLTVTGVIGTTSGGLIVNAGTMQVNGANTFTGAVNVASGATIQFGGTGNVLGTTAGITTIASGGSLNVNGQANTSTEPVTINGTGISSGGAIRNSSATSASFAGPITVASNSLINTPNGALTLSGAINLGNNVLTIGGTTGRLVLTGLISGTGSLVVNSYTTGDFNPQNANSTYSGGTILNAGSFTIPSNGSIGPAGAPTSGPYGVGVLTLNGGQMRSGAGGPMTIANTTVLSADSGFYTTAAERSLILSGPMTITGASRTLTSTVGTSIAGTAAFITGSIGDGGNAFGITKAGAGNLVLSGSNTYTGPTVVNAGSLTIRGGQVANTNYTVTAANLSLLSGTENALSSVNTLSITGGSSLNLELGSNTANSDRLASANPATISGSVTLNLAGLTGIAAGSYDVISAASGLNGGTYAIGNVAGGFTYGLTNTDSAVTVTLTASPNATGNLYWRGGFNSSWSVWNGGTTNFTTDPAGVTNSGIVPGPANTVIFSATSAVGPAITTTLDNVVKINDLRFSNNPAGVTGVTINPGATVGASLEIGPAVSTAGISVAANAGAIVIAAPVVLTTAQTWTVDTTSTLTISGGVSGNATNALIISGLATLSTVNGSTSSYGGSTTIPNGSVLQAGAANSFSPNSAVTVSGTGILRINGFNNAIGSLAGDGIVQNNTATGVTLTAGADGTSTTFSGLLQNGGTANLGFAKTGAGTLILTGANTHTGTTTINGGILRFSGTMAASPIVINSGGTAQIGVAGGLTVLNAVTVAGTGVLDLFGNSVTVGAFTSTSTTASITNSGSGSGTDSLTLSVATATTAAIISDGPTRFTQIIVNNANNGTITTTNPLNTYSGGLVLANNAAGTRININAALTQVASIGSITTSPFGRGTISIGQAATDRAGLYFSFAGNTLFQNVTFNTELGTDRFGIRSDVANTTLAGVITTTAGANAVFTANNATNLPAIALINQVTGPGGLVVDLSQTTTANTVLTVTLNNATVNPNNYTGDTVVGRTAVAPAQSYSAILALGASDQIPNGATFGNLVLNNNTAARTGTFRLAGFNETINGLSGSGIVDGFSGSPVLTVGDNNATATFSGVIQNTAGTLNLTKIGSGTQTLSGTSTFAGAVTVNAGAIAFDASANLGDASATNAISLNGGTLRYTGAGAVSLGVNRAITLGASGGTLQASNSTGVLTVDGGIALASTGNLSKIGPGGVTVIGAINLNGGAGSAFVNDGTLTASFGTSGLTNLTVGSTGSLQFVNTTAETLTLGTGGLLTLAGGSRLGFELGIPLSSDAIAVPTTVANIGTVTLDFYNLGGLAAGTYNLITAAGGLNLATYSLGTAPNGFNYQINTTPTLVSLAVTAFDPIYWNNGAATTSWATSIAGPITNWSTDAAGTVNAAIIPNAAKTVIFSATNVVGPTLTTTLDVAFTVDSIQFTAAGTPAMTSVTVAAGTGGALTLAPVSSSGGVLVQPAGFTATISAPLTIASAQTWNVTDATGALIVTGNTAFNAAVNKTGLGAVTLSGINTGTGAINLSAGKLNIDSNNALGGTSLVIAAGTTIDSPTTNITVTTTNAQTWNGNFTFAGTGGSINFTAAASTVLLGNSLTLTTTQNTYKFDGIISDGGNNRSLTKAGLGSLQLDGANTYGGGTNHLAGALIIGNASALGTGTVTFAGGNFDYILATPSTLVGNLPIVFSGNTSFTGTNSLNLGAGATSFNVTPNITIAANTLTIGGTVTGGLNGLTKSGPGSLVLAGTGSTWAGTTTVSDGTLNVTGSVTSGPLNVANALTSATVNLTGTGSLTTAASTMTIGSAAGVNGVLNVGPGTTLTATSLGGAGGGLVLGSATNSNGVINQTGGNVTVENINWGAGPNGPNVSYAMYNMTGGTLTHNNSANTARFRIANASANSIGLLYMSGNAAITFNSFTGSGGSNNLELTSSGTASTTGGSPVGVIAITGTAHLLSTTPGNFNISATINTTVATTATGQVTIGGAGSTNARLTVAGISASSTVAGAGNLGNSVINLNAGGTLTTGNIAKNANGTSFINFNGGTLRVATTGTTVAAHTGGYVHAGGATIDMNGAALYSFNTPLLEPVGFGLASIAATAVPGAGYAGAPAVVISGGSGSGATAIAQVSGGQVTGFTVTHPGSGYLDTDVLTYTLFGGGFTTAATVDATVAANYAANASGGLTKLGGGTLALGGANTYTGPTTYTAGTLQLGSGGTTGSLNPASVISYNAASTFAFNRTNAIVQGVDFSPLVINAGALTQAGTGITTLVTDNTYPGATTINAGGLQLGNGGTTGAIGAGPVANNSLLIFNRTNTYSFANVLTGTGSVVIDQGTLTFPANLATSNGLGFGSASTVTTAGTLNLDTVSATFGGVFRVQNNNAIGNAVTIGAGQTLTVNNNFIMSNTISTSRMKITMSGAGGFILNNNGGTFQVNVGPTGTNVATQSELDMSGLATFSTNLGTTGSMTIGVQSDNSNAVANGPYVNRMFLAATSTITAGTLTIGGSSSGQPVVGEANNLLLMGSGVTTINVNSLVLGGGGRDSGNLSFNTPTGTLQIRAADGVSPANLSMAATGGGGTGYTYSSFLDTRGHSVDLLFGTVIMSAHTRNTTPANLTNTIFFDNGVMTMNSVSAAIRTAGASATYGSTATIEVGGGTANFPNGIQTFSSVSGTSVAGVTTIANLNVTGGIVNLGQSAGVSVNMASSTIVGAIATANLNFTGGTINVTGSVLRAGGVGTTNANLTLNGATLNMNANVIGSLILPVTFNAQSGTLSNLAELNGGGTLTKTTAGTLNMAGTMTYTGRTVINDGVLTFTSISNVGAVSSNLGAPALINSVIGLGETTTTGTLRFLGITDQTTDRSLDLAGTTGGGTLDASGNEAAITFSNAIMTATGAGSKAFTLTGTNAGGNTLAAVIVDNLTGTNVTTVNKTGAGRWILTGASTYTGNTTLTSGTLAMSGTASHATSPIVTVGTTAGSTAILNVNALSGGANFSASGYTLATNQTLAGQGTVNATTFGFSSPATTTVAPGVTSAGTLSILGNSVLAGNYAWDMATAGTNSAWPTPIANGGSTPILPHTNHDVLTITGTANVTGLTFNLTSLGTTGMDPSAYYSWTAITSTGALTGTPTLGSVPTGIDFANAIALGGTFSISTDTNNVYINYTPAPEPALLGLMAAGVLLLRRRRSR